MRERDRKIESLIDYGKSRSGRLILSFIVVIAVILIAIISSTNSSLSNSSKVATPARHSSQNSASNQVPQDSLQNVSSTPNRPSTSAPQPTTSASTTVNNSPSTLTVDPCSSVPQLSSIASNSISRMRSDSVNAVIDFANNGGYSNDLINNYIAQSNQLLQKSYNDYLSSLNGCAPVFSAPIPIPSYPWH